MPDTGDPVQGLHMPQPQGPVSGVLGDWAQGGDPQTKDRIDNLGGAAAGAWGENGAWKNRGRDRPTLAQIDICAYSGALWGGG